MGVNERVKKVFNAKAESLVGHGLQLEGRLDREGVWVWQTPELTTDVLDDLIRHWRDPDAIIVAKSCSASRQTVDEHGHGPMLQSTGQKPHAGIRLDMIIKYLI